MYVSYDYIINDIAYQCCIYSYSFGKIGKKYIENSNNQILGKKKRALETLVFWYIYLRVDTLLFSTNGV